MYNCERHKYVFLRTEQCLKVKVGKTGLSKSYLFLSLAIVGIVSPAPVKRVMRQRSLKVSMSVMIEEMLFTRRSTSLIIRSVKRLVDLLVSNKLSFRILERNSDNDSATQRITGLTAFVQLKNYEFQFHEIRLSNKFNSYCDKPTIL